jgi:UDP-N-acetyl-D-glucosamine/UDP-N-acetyl-D-galactosamine dehydrogenase
LNIMKKLSDIEPAVIDLGYVGLPLAVEFGKRRPGAGFAIDAASIAALKARCDAILFSVEWVGV